MIVHTEEEYKTQVDSLEAGKAELERKLEHVENDLKTRHDGNGIYEC